MKPTDLNIELLSVQTLKDVPSASGIVMVNDGFYVIGDDVPYLFHLDKHFNLISKTQIYDLNKLQGTTIPKIDKPDFEAMELVSATELIVFGSGSKSPERDVCILVKLGEEIRYKVYDISLFYQHLRQMEMMLGYELNVEGIAFQGDVLYLFNRGRNLIFSFSYPEFIGYCESGTCFPIPETSLFSLPNINGLAAGFSGATTFGDRPYLIFTAAVEDAPNAYEDGAIVGSFMGIIALEDGTVSADFLIEQIPNPGFPLKVESVIIDKIISDNQADLVLVTDNDGGPSAILRLRMGFSELPK